MTTATTATTARSDLDQLAAVLAHARQHDLAGTIGSIGFGGFIDVCVYLRGTRAFLRWAKSIGADEISRKDSDYFYAAGKLSDGSAAEASIAVFNTNGETTATLEVLLGLRCTSCRQRLDDTELTTPIGDVGERIHDACAETLTAAAGPRGGPE